MNLKWFSWAHWKALVSCRHDLAGSADAHRHQVSFGIVFQAGWSLVFSPLWALDQHHLTLGCADSTSTPSPSISPCAPAVSGEILESFYDLLCIFISACAYLMEWSVWNTRLLLLLLFIDAGLGPTLGEELARWAGGRRQDTIAYCMSLTIFWRS